MLNLLIAFILLNSVTWAAQPSGSLKNFFKDKTKIENPFNLRDPFKAPLSSRGSSGPKNDQGYRVTGKGQYSNIGEVPLDQLQLQEIKLVGVLIGKERRALINQNKDNKKVLVLKEGMKIGPENAELKAILPGGIVLVEKIVNVYGEEEYLETVIPISR